MEIVKCVNIFLSVFGYILNCDSKDKDNLDLFSIVDEKGLIVGTLSKTAGTDILNSEIYDLNISSLKFGEIHGMVFKKSNGGSNHHTFSVAINSKKIENSPFYNEIGETMEIIMPSSDNKVGLQISNLLRLYNNGKIVYEFYADGSDKTISFSTPENRLRIYMGDNGNYRYKASHSPSGQEINIIQNGNDLEYSFGNNNEELEEKPKVSEIPCECTPVESMCKLATSIQDQKRMHYLKNPISFVKELRKICCYGEELCIFNNISSIVLGEYTNAFSKSDMKEMLGLVPWELPNTPIVNGEGNVLSPREKKRPKRRTTQVTETL